MLSGVVLAGGMGSRMGGDKGLMELCSKPMVLHVVGAVSRVAGDITVAVGKGRGDAYSRVLGTRARVVEDREEGRGPLEGLSRAFRVAENEYVAVAPCDAVLVKEQVLSTLSSRAQGAEGAVPVVRGFIEPLVAVYHRDAGLRAFEAELSSGRRKVRDAISGLDIRTVDEEELRSVDPGLVSFLNVNSQEDLRRAEALVSGQRDALR